MPLQRGRRGGGKLREWQKLVDELTVEVGRVRAAREEAGIKDVLDYSVAIGIRSKKARTRGDWIQIAALALELARRSD